jgi:hypothetical protein
MKPPGDNVVLSIRYVTVASISFMSSYGSPRSSFLNQGKQHTQYYKYPPIEIREN